MILTTSARLYQTRKKKLHKSESHLKAIFDNMKSGLIVYKVINNGEDFVILALNQAAQGIENVRGKALLGKSALTVWSWIKDTGLLDAFRETATTKQPAHKTVSILRKEDERGWREYYLYNLPSGEMVAIYDDITDKVQAEEEHRALQEQLFTSQKMESKGGFAGGIAHNFRNIL